MNSDASVGTYNVKIIALARKFYLDQTHNDVNPSVENNFVFTINNGCNTATFVDKELNNMSVKMGASQTQAIHFDSAYTFYEACGEKTLTVI